MPDHVRAIFGSFQVSFIVSTTATLLELAKFCSMDTLELCGDILQPVGQLENPVLLMLIHHMVADFIYLYSVPNLAFKVHTYSPSSIFRPIPTF